MQKNANKKMLSLLFMMSLLSIGSSCFGMDAGVQAPDPQEEIKQKNAEILKLQEELKKQSAEADNFATTIDKQKQDMDAAKKKYRENLEKYAQEQKEFSKTYEDEKKQWKKASHQWDREKAEFNAKMETLKTQAKIDNHSTYTFTHAPFPEKIAESQANLASAQIDLHKAQTKRAEYENGWTKMGFDFVGETGKHIVAPVLVQGLLPVVHDWRKEHYPTAAEKREEEILALRRKKEELDFAMQQQVQAQNEATQKQNQELFESEQHTKEVIRFRHLCDGNNNNTVCQQMGEMLGAMEYQEIAKMYQKKFGKPYAPKA